MDRIKPTSKLPSKLSRKLYHDDPNSAGESYLHNIKQEDYQYCNGNNDSNDDSTDDDDCNDQKYEKMSLCSPKCGLHCNKENFAPQYSKPATISREITNFIRFTNSPISHITAIEHSTDAKLSISINQKIVYMSIPTN